MCASLAAASCLIQLSTVYPEFGVMSCTSSLCAPSCELGCVGVQANAMYCSFPQVQDVLLLLHPVCEHPSKEQQSLTGALCLVLLKGGKCSRGLECQIGLELPEVWHSLTGR